MAQAAKALDALGDATRRSIFEKLGKGPLAVAEIAKGMSVSRPAVSQHLKVLRAAKLITMNKKGTQSICCIRNEGITTVHAYLDKFWNRALEAFKQAAEKEAAKQQKK